MADCKIHFKETEILLEEGGYFSFVVSLGQRRSDTRIVLDVYAMDDRRHPEGHVGWWEFVPEGDWQDFEGTITLREGEFHLELRGLPVHAHWGNGQIPGTDRLVLMLVVKDSKAGELLVERQLPVFANRTACEDYRRLTTQSVSNIAYAPSWYFPLEERTVRIVARNIFIRDAVGEFALATFYLLRRNGINAEMYSENYELGLSDKVKNLERLFNEVAETDVVLYFYSTHDPWLIDVLAARAHSKILYYHGVTRPELLERHDPELSGTCRKAYSQLRMLSGFDVIAANSVATAGQLAAYAGVNIHDVVVVPPKIANMRARVGCANEWKMTSGARLLYVGRIKPHKKIEDLLKLFRYFLEYDGAAILTIVGRKEGEYGEFLDELQRKLLGDAADKVEWAGSIAQEDLERLYESADAYLSMSEDEGFCVPLLEAMAAGVPVFAYGIPAVVEVLGRSGCFFMEKDFPSLAKRIANTLSDRKEIDRMKEVQYRRLAEFKKVMDGSAMLGLLERALTS